MKKMIVVISMLTVFGCTVSRGYAAPAERMAVVRVGEIFKVIYEGENLATVKVVISDSDGSMVFSEELISTHGFVRPYNFSKLPKGDYEICIVDQNAKHSKKICFEDRSETVCSNEDNKKELTAHVARLQGKNRYLVSIPHQVNNNVEINIYNGDDELVFSEKQKLNNDFVKVYRLKNLDGATIKLLSENGEEKIFRAGAVK